MAAHISSWPNAVENYIIDLFWICSERYGSEDEIKSNYELRRSVKEDTIVVARSTTAIRRAAKMYALDKSGIEHLIEKGWEKIPYSFLGNLLFNNKKYPYNPSRHAVKCWRIRTGLSDYMPFDRYMNTDIVRIRNGIKEKANGVRNNPIRQDDGPSNFGVRCRSVQ